MAQEALPAVLAVAVDRRYLGQSEAEALAREARRTQKVPEALLVERGLLSARRVERLLLHVRYRGLRKVDKAYARVALKARIVDEATVSAALDQQRRRFEERRDCLRIGAILIKQGHVTPDEDRHIRSRVARLSQGDSASQSAAATLLDDSASQGTPRGGLPAVKEPSYEKIDEAVARVEAVRKEQAELSESVSQRGQPVTADSAAEYENACVVLARRRVAGGGKPVSKSTGALRIGA
ncbi:MAG: hypothetical protein M9894_01430 [Planctomycetes bacterium]|nr:hypothetical protein [Planctomycetota bacterium]